MGTGTCRSICWDPSAARKINWTVSAAERHERWGQSVGIRDPDTIPLIAAAEGGLGSVGCLHQVSHWGSARLSR